MTEIAGTHPDPPHTDTPDRAAPAAPAAAAAPAAPTSPAAPRARPLRVAIAVAAVAGTAPYLLMKALWLAGFPVGVSDPSMLASTSMTVLNAVTVGLDLCVIALAVTLTARWGARLPAVVVLLPAWVATGLLAPMVLVVLPGTLLSGGGGGGDDGLAPWVRPMVYGGFAWQGAFLLAAFALYAHARWGASVRGAGRVRPGPVRDLQRALTGGGAGCAVVSAVLLVLAGATSGGGAGAVVVAALTAALALAGAAGAVALVRGPATARGTVAAVVAAWTGSGSMFAWGLWTAATTMGATALSGAGHPAYGLAQLTGLLGGFALGAAGLLALTAGDAEPARA